MDLFTLGKLFNQSLDNHQKINAFSIDTRTLIAGDVFLAIKGEAFNGHQFLEEAYKKGAIAAIVEREDASIPLTQIVVNDTTVALGVIAKAHRINIHCPVIALTGSNGKTTVKEMIANILPKPSFATKGNFNNHIGAPLSVLALTNEDRYAVFELGANHVGEIAYTVSMVQPDVTLINNIAPAHIGEFGSIERVAETKGEIYQGLSANGIAIVNDDDVFHHFWDNILADKKVIRFSAIKKADVYAESIKVNEAGCAAFELILPEGRAHVQLPLPGMHLVNNALAAASATSAIGIDLKMIVEGLETFSGVKGRLQFKKAMKESWVIDDTYNANVRSMLVALEVLSHRKGIRVAVLGDMGELGDYAISHHEEIGARAKELGIEKLYTVGTLTEHTARAYGNKALHYSDKKHLLDDLMTVLDGETTVLVKGSRSAKMEDIVKALVV